MLQRALDKRLAVDNWTLSMSQADSWTLQMTTLEWEQLREVCEILQVNSILNFSFLCFT